MHLLHPRPSRAGAAVYRPVGVTADVLAMVVESGPTHPRDVRARFGARRTVNDWGGNSAVTTRALEELHYQGLLRVVRRENGTKIYESVRARSQNVPAHERLERLTMLIARTLAPTPESSLRSAIGQLCHASGGFVEPRTAVADLMERGDLRATLVDGVRYVWPRSMRVPTDSIEARQVRFLAPFDPVVWDRRRFAHLWGWQYRLEAYVPANRRQFGYYALPVLWGNDAIGWVNCARTPKGALSVDVGYTNGPIKTRDLPQCLRHGSGPLGVDARRKERCSVRAVPGVMKIMTPRVTDERPVPDATRHDARHPTLESDRAHLSRRAGQPRSFVSSAAA